VAADVINGLSKLRHCGGSDFIAHIEGVTGNSVPAAADVVQVQNVAFI
jgi:hypothetical protein